MKTLFLTATDGTKRPILIAGSAVVVPVKTPAEPPPFDAESAGLPYRTEFTFKTIADAERGIRYKNRSYICMVEGAPMRVVPSGTGHGLATCSAAEDGSFERAVVVFVAEKRNEWQATHNASTARAALRVALALALALLSGRPTDGMKRRPSCVRRSPLRPSARSPGGSPTTSTTCSR